MSGVTMAATLLADRWSVVAGLRWWAQGVPTDEAAVELLAGLGARFASARCAWVRPCRRPGWYWLDPDQLSRYPGRLSASERRVLALVVALLGGQPALSPVEAPVSSGAVLSGRAAA